MSDNQQIRSSNSSNLTADNVEDTLQGLEINGTRDSSVQTSPNPSHSKERNCLHYLRSGLCVYGNNCRFNHPPYVSQGAIYFNEELPERIGQPDCDYFLRTGTCKYGSTCKYHHPKDRNGAGPVSFNILGFPMREGEQACPFYMRNGTCKFAVACKFHHPQPASHGNVVAANGQASFPLVNPPFAGGFPTFPLATATNGSGPRIQDPQTYVPAPIMVSAPPGMIPQVWNPYMGNVSSAYPVLPNPVPNSKNQANPYFGPQVPVMATSAGNLPEKPDQPECWHFMNTGICRYGVDCRYNHPKERTSQLSSVPNPFRFPSRPGRPICSNFNATGFCKFGPVCKFDHPFMTYPLSYGYPIPPMPTYNSTITAYQRVSPANNVPETSHMVQNNNSETPKSPKEPNGVNENAEVKKTDQTSHMVQNHISESPKSPEKSIGVNENAEAKKSDETSETSHMVQNHISETPKSPEEPNSGNENAQVKKTDGTSSVVDSQYQSD